MYDGCAHPVPLFKIATDIIYAIMEKLELKARMRTETGRSKIRNLRVQGFVPAVLYGEKMPAKSLLLKSKDLYLLLRNEASLTQILTLIIDGVDVQVILRDLQHHPVKPLILHADFLRVSKTHRLQVHVPLHFINRDICVGVKVQGGMITHPIVEAEVSCFPKDIPPFIEVDVSELTIGRNIHLKDITLAKGVEFVALSHDDNQLVVSVIKARGVASEDDMSDGEAEESKEDVVSQKSD